MPNLSRLNITQLELIHDMLSSFENESVDVSIRIDISRRIARVEVELDRRYAFVY